MLTLSQFFGNGKARNGGTAFLSPYFRVQKLLAGVPSTLKLPKASYFVHGGPFFILHNASGGSLTLKDFTGTITVGTLANSTATWVYLSASGWKLNARPLASATFGTINGRTHDIGYRSSTLSPAGDSDPGDGCAATPGDPDACATDNAPTAYIARFNPGGCWENDPDDTPGTGTMIRGAFGNSEGWGAMFTSVWDVRLSCGSETVDGVVTRYWEIVMSFDVIGIGGGANYRKTRVDGEDYPTPGEFTLVGFSEGAGGVGIGCFTGSTFTLF